MGAQASLIGSWVEGNAESTEFLIDDKDTNIIRIDTNSRLGLSPHKRFVHFQ